MHTVCAGGLERGNTPVDRILHGRRTGNAASDLVCKLFKVGGERRGLQGLGVDEFAVLGFLGNNRAEHQERDNQSFPAWHRRKLETKWGESAKSRPDLRRGERRDPAIMKSHQDIFKSKGPCHFDQREESAISWHRRWCMRQQIPRLPFCFGSE